MKIGEVARKSVDILRGPRVEGSVAAILPPQHFLNYRYAVKTREGIVDAHIPAFEGMLGYYVIRPEFKIGDRLALRAAKVRPWMDGQRV